MRARAGVLAGVMAWPALTLALARSTTAGVPEMLDGTAGLDEALGTVAALVGLAVLAWLALVVTAATCSALLPREGRACGVAEQIGVVVTPTTLRRLLAVAIAGAIVSGGSPAQAATGSGGHRPAATASAAIGPVTGTADDDLDPGWAPALMPTDGSATTAGFDPAWGTPGRARRAAYPDDEVVVRRGDTLWDLAARHLGSAATDAEIAHAWPHWFTANRATIGPDPDRLTPGQRLHPPASRAGGQP